MQITYEQYMMGRDKTHFAELTQAAIDNANDLLDRANRLLIYVRNADFETSPRTGTVVESGWRPPSLNATIPTAAPKSKHMTGQAIDIYDPYGEIKAWCWDNQHILGQLDIDLYMEHPAATKGWCHLQSVPPRSQANFPITARKRWFYP